MGRVHEDFKKENYAIAIHTVGESTRPSALGTTSGTALIAISGSATLGSLTVFGTRKSSTKITYETLTVATTAGTTSTVTDWVNVYGMRMGDIYGVSLSTQSVDISLVSAANTSDQVAVISSSGKSTKAQLYQMTGQNVTLHVISGNVFYKSEGTLPTSNNAFRMTDGMIRDLRVSPESPYLMLQSDTGGARVQISVQRD